MFSIFTDSSANLPTPYLAQHAVQCIPLTYLVDGKEYCCTDTETFDGDTFYETLRSAAEVSTSQVPPQRYIDHFTPALERGEDILFVGMSSGISGSFNAAVMAAQMLRADYPEWNIRLIDTLAASLGEGIFVMDAIAMRDAGKTLDETAEALDCAQQSMYQVVVLDDLKFLHRTGRVSGKAAVVGSLLNIKPILKGNAEGQLVVCGKARGKKHALQELADRYAQLSTGATEQTVGIAYTDCPEDAETLAKMIKKIRRPRELLVVRYEPVTGSHVGPGTVALFFKGANGVREH